MALKKAAAKKAGVKKAGAKKAAVAAKAAPKATHKAKTKPLKAKVAEKRAVVRTPPRSTKPEPPAVDHGATLGPLYLGAGHGHLSRPVDKAWLDALTKYRNALQTAVDYEGKRSPMARAVMVLNFARQLQTLMTNLGLRVTALIQETQMPQLDTSAKQTAQKAAQALIENLSKLNEVLGAMVGPDGISPLGDTSIPSGQLQQLEQLQRVHYNNIARFADLDRAVTASNS